MHMYMHTRTDRGSAEATVPTGGEPDALVAAEPSATGGADSTAADSRDLGVLGSADSRGLGALGAEEPSSGRSSTELDRLRQRTLRRGVNMPLLMLTKAILIPLFRVFLRLEGRGAADLPRTGPLLLASNHRSFLDPFVIGALIRRPIYYVAKRELFSRRWQAWLLGGLGAFPIDRGAADRDAMATAKAILERGDCVVIFPEGTRVRPGPLGTPRRGVGRLALESGAPVVPVAVLGTDGVRAGWRLRPRKVRVRFGRQIVFTRRPRVDPTHAAGVTARIWGCIASQWEAMGGQVRKPRLEAGGREPSGVDAPAAHEQLEGAAVTLEDRLGRAAERSVPSPATREDSLAARRSPYTLQ